MALFQSIIKRQEAERNSFRKRSSRHAEHLHLHEEHHRQHSNTNTRELSYEIGDIPASDLRVEVDDKSVVVKHLKDSEYTQVICVNIPDDVDASKTTATCRHGILHVVMHLREGFVAPARPQLGTDAEEELDFGTHNLIQS